MIGRISPGAADLVYAVVALVAVLVVLGYLWGAIHRGEW